MTDAQEILRLIETADPADTAKLDEIDIMVHRFLYGSIRPIIEPDLIVKYTRSRDALKEIRPDGWMIYEGCQDYLTAVWYCTLVNPKYGGENAVTTGEILTEELAELHAIIQAIAYDRGEK